MGPWHRTTVPAAFVDSVHPRPVEAARATGSDPGRLFQQGVGGFCPVRAPASVRAAGAYQAVPFAKSVARVELTDEITEEFVMIRPSSRLEFSDVLEKFCEPRKTFALLVP